MASLAEYFANNRIPAKYEFGERVFGKWNKIPFIGSVGSDGVVSEEEGPRVTVTVDLPIMYQGKVFTCIVVKHKDIKRLKSFDEEETNDKSTNSKTRSKKPVLDSNGRNRKSR